MTAKITIDGAYATLTGTPMSTVRDLLSPFDPQRFYNPSFRQKRWDGRIKLYDGRRFPSGLWQAVAKCLTLAGIEYEFEDTSANSGEVSLDRFATDILPGITLYPHQDEVCRAILSESRGIARSPTASGKGEMIVAVALYLFREMGWRSLVIVPKKGLAVQQAERFRRYVGDEMTVGQCGDGKKTIGDVTVATAQTLAGFKPRRKKVRNENRHELIPANPELLKLVTETEVLMFDEAHHTSADGWYDIALTSKAVRRYGFSGTPLKDSAPSDLKLQGATGPIVVNISAKSLIEAGLAARPKIIMVMSDNASNAELPEVWSEKRRCMAPMEYPLAYKKGIVESDQHNRAVIRAVEWMVDHGRRTLVICRYKQHFRILEELLKDNGINYASAWGDTETEERDRLKELLTVKKLDCILSTSLPPHEWLIVREHGVVSQATIEEVTERYLEPHVVDSAAVRDGLEVLSVDPKGVAQFRSVTAVHRHHQEAPLVRVCASSSGFGVEVTENHSLVDIPAWKRVEPKKGNTYSAVTSVVLPETTTQVDIAAGLQDVEGFYGEIETWIPHSFMQDRVKLRAWLGWELGLRTKPVGFTNRELRRVIQKTATIEHKGAMYVFLSGVINKKIKRVKDRHRVELEFYVENREAIDKLTQVYVRRERSKTRTFDRVELTERFAEWLGLFVAEGSVTFNPSTTLSVIASLEGNIENHFVDGQQVGSDYIRALAEYGFRHLGLWPKKNSKQVLCSSNVLGFVLTWVIGVGVHAPNKRVPTCIFNAPSNIKLWFLRGLYIGDGSSSLDGKTTTTCHTVSPVLTQGVNLLLRALGERRVSIGLSPPEESHHHERYRVSTPDSTELNYGRDTGRAGSSGRVYYDVDGFNDVHQVRIERTVHQPSTEFVYDLSVEGVENFVAGTGLVVCHNTIFDEGEDVPAIDAVVLAEGIKAQTNAVQRIGRGMRRKDGDNDFWVVDFVPLCHPTLQKHAMERCSAYEGEEYEVQLVDEWPEMNESTPDDLFPFVGWTNGA